MALAAGTLVGRYRIRSRLGAGGMGVVYLADDERLGRLVALKVMAPELTVDPTFRERFLAEARAAAAVDHPHVVPIHEAGEHEDFAFLVMRYVRGSDLATLIQRHGPLSLARTATLVGQIAGALDAAHAVGLIHRDVKPANVLVDDGDHAYLADFGLARAAEASVGLTRPNQLAIGSAGYMPPELIEGRPVSARSDVYALACVAFACLTGRPPFLEGGDLTTLYAQVTKPAPPPSRFRTGLPPIMDLVFERALEKDPADRPSSAGRFATELARAAGVGAGDAGSAALDGPPADDRADGSDPGPTPVVEEPGPADAWPRPRDARGRLFGRDRELDELEGLVNDRTVRLVTITGPGGIGKTRAALELARRLGPAHPGRVAFVELDAVRDPELVIPTIDRAIGGDGELADRIGGARAILVLDNLEQVLGCAPALDRLLDASPGLTIVATSREPLGLGGERRYPLEALAEAAAVALFVACAAGIRGGVTASPSITAICRRIDHLPLAIELAAARLSILTPEQLLGRLDRALAVLTKGQVDAPERQRTLRATIEWSESLLVPRERDVFAAFGVFAGGATLDAAESVAGADLDVLDSLVAKSLLRVRFDAVEPRFALPETIREYALERLEALGRFEDVAGAHAGWVLELARTTASLLGRAEGAAEYERLEREHANIRAALGWAAERGHHVLRWSIAVSLGDFWQTRGHLEEARRWLEDGLEDAGLPDELHLDVLDDLASTAVRQGDTEAVGRYAEATIERAEIAGNLAVAAAARAKLMTVAIRSGDLDRARTLYDEAIATATSIDHRRALLVTLTGLGNLELAAGRPDVAHVAFARVADLVDEFGRRESVATARFNLALAAHLAGDRSPALVALDHAVATYAEIGDTEGLGYCLELIAAVLAGDGASEAAAEALGAASAALDAAGASLELVESRLHDATVARVGSALGDRYSDRFAAGQQAGTEDAERIAKDLLRRLSSSLVGEPT